MNDLARIMTASSLAFAVAVAFPGCRESTGSPSAASHSADHGHDHPGEGGRHEGHDHAEEAHDKPDGFDHGQMRSSGTVTIAGTTLDVAVVGEIKPSSPVEIELEVTAGPVPSAVRVWVGDQAGTGALKSKADGHGDHFHAQTEAPATLAGASLWIEIEAADGERRSASIPLQ